MKKLFILTLLSVTALVAQAQIPNNSFEDWTQIGTYWNPNSWGCLNTLTAPLSIFTCERGTPGNPGNYYLKLTSKTGIGSIVIPGIAVCGTLDEATYLPTNGFPFTQRPQKLTGKWQHMIFGTSQGYIEVELTKWNSTSNSRDVIAYTHQQLSGMAMSWATFNITLNYQSSDTPDSCIIVLAASGTNPSNQDYLWVDNLSFSGSVGVNDQEPITEAIKVFPNPASKNFTIEYSCVKQGEGIITLADQNGKIVFNRTQPFIAGLNRLAFSAGDLNLSPGAYIIGINNNNKLIQQRIVIQ
jgi:hypothetical protein